MTTGWQPIETAPKDGTRILAVGPERTVVITLWGKVSHVPIYGWLDQVAGDPEDTTYWHPTYWMPLPPPPATGGTGR
jgi:hypothetical protein